MSFFYQTSAAAARSRRTKDREGHPRASSASTSGRRHGTNTKAHDSRSPQSKSPVLQPALYTQQNVGLDKLPALPSSEATIPIHVSPSSSIHQSAYGRAGVFHLTQQPFTPMALQQYLDQDEDDGEDEEKKEEQVSENQSNINTNWKMSVENGRSFVNQTSIAEPTLLSEKTSFKTQYDTTLRSSTNMRSRTNSSDPAPSKAPVESLSSKDLHTLGSEINQMNNGTGSPGSYSPIEKIRSLPQNAGLFPQTTETKRRPLSEVLGHGNSEITSQEAPKDGHTMARTPSQHSAPLLSRTFTPPALPRGITQTAMTTSPVLVSPMPIRSGIRNDYYSAYGPGQHQYSFRSSIEAPESGYHVPYQPFPEQDRNLTGGHNFGDPTHSMYELGRVYSNEVQNEDPGFILARLHTMLPQIQMLINSYQHLDLNNVMTRNGHPGMSTAEESTSETKVQQLKAEVDQAAAKHREEISILNSQVLELQTKSKYFESEAASQKKARDTIYEELVTLRVESASRTKSLMAEKVDLQTQLDNIKRSTEKAIEDGVNDVRMKTETDILLISTLQKQIDHLQSSHTVEREDSRKYQDQKHNNMLKEHGQAVEKLEKQLREQSQEIIELQHELKDERIRLQEQFKLDKAKIMENHEKQIAVLNQDLQSERTHSSHLKEDNLRLGRELDKIREQSHRDRIGFNTLKDHFRTAAAKMHQENANLLKILEDSHDAVGLQSHDTSSSLLRITDAKLDDSDVKSVGC